MEEGREGRGRQGKAVIRLIMLTHYYYCLLILQSQSLELVTIAIVINVVIGGFSGEDLRCLAHVTVQLQVSDYSHEAHYTVRL